MIVDQDKFTYIGYLITAILAMLFIIIVAWLLIDLHIEIKKIKAAKNLSTLQQNKTPCNNNTGPQQSITPSSTSTATISHHTNSLIQNSMTDAILAPHQLPYAPKMLLTKTEYAFYIVLKNLCDQNNLLICPKVRMEDFLTVTDEENTLRYRGFIKSRHIDFLICNSKLYLLAGLELDDSSHLTPEALVHDMFKSQVFHAIQVPLFRVKVTRQEFYELELNKIIQSILKTEKKPLEEQKQLFT